jgi:hypothetical protein
VRKRPSFDLRKFLLNLHKFLLNAKVITVEIASAVVFVWIVIHVVMRELR